MHKTTKHHFIAFDYFRAISIILIVAGHSYGLADIEINTPLDRVLSLLVKGATAYFVFISGFMFEHISVTNFGYRAFMLQKLRRIGLPYFILSACLFLPIWPWGAWPLNPSAAWNLFIFGDGFQAYWYVPFILVVFGLSPLWFQFSRMPVWGQVLSMSVLTILSLITHRPIDNDNHLQSLVYYAPLFGLGILFCQNYGHIARRRPIWMLGLACLALGLTLQMAATWQSDTAHKAMFAWQGFDLNIIQKAAFCILVPLCFHRAPALGFVTGLAQISFAIFFLHPFVILMFEKASILALPTLFIWLNLAYVTVVITGISVLIAKLVHMTLGKLSADVVGY